MTLPGARVLHQQLGGEWLEKIELAGARPMDGQAHRRVEILLEGAQVHVELASNAPHRPTLAHRQPVNFVDLVRPQHDPLINCPRRQHQGSILYKKRFRSSREAQEIEESAVRSEPSCSLRDRRLPGVTLHFTGRLTTSCFQWSLRVS